MSTLHHLQSRQAERKRPRQRKIADWDCTEGTMVYGPSPRSFACSRLSSHYSTQEPMVKWMRANSIHTLTIFLKLVQKRFINIVVGYTLVLIQNFPPIPGKCHWHFRLSLASWLGNPSEGNPLRDVYPGTESSQRHHIYHSMQRCTLSERLSVISISGDVDGTIFAAFVSQYHKVFQTMFSHEGMSNNVMQRPSTRSVILSCMLE